jgi:GDPmannose 4,6-dehydratase
MLLTINPIPGSTYNIGGEHTATVGEILNFLVEQSTLSDFRIEVDPARLRPIDADLQIPDTTKFKNHTGWAPHNGPHDIFVSG